MVRNGEELDMCLLEGKSPISRDDVSAGSKTRLDKWEGKIEHVEFDGCLSRLSRRPFW